MRPLKPRPVLEWPGSQYHDSDSWYRHQGHTPVAFHSAIFEFLNSFSRAPSDDCSRFAPSITHKG